MSERRPFREGLLTLDPLALVGSKCHKCGTASFPKRAVCPNCREEDSEDITLSGSGHIYTYTIVRQAPPGEEVPYGLAYVDLPEGVRLMTRIDRKHLDELEIGLPVRLGERDMGTADDGTELVGYQFEPAH